MHVESEGRSNGRGVDCSVLVPVLNEERYVSQSVRAMQAQEFHGGLEFLFVDGGSTDRTRAILAQLAREDPRIRILDNPRGSTASGLNVALGHARGRWIARMDAHTEYAADYLAHGIRRLEGGDTSWVSGPAVPSGDGLVSGAVSLALSTWLGRAGSRKWSTGTDGQGGETELDAGVFAGVWERRTLLQLRGWDERWLKNEDSELAGRFLERGERLVCLPAMAARYAPRDSIPGLWRQYLSYGEYRAKTAVRHPHTMRRSHLIAPWLVIACLAATAGPASIRRLARAALALYAACLAGTSVGVAGCADDVREAMLVPLALAVMHLAWGTGTLRGAARHGLPLAAVAGALGIDRISSRPAARAHGVFAPSLSVPEDEVA